MADHHVITNPSDDLGISRRAVIAGGASYGTALVAGKALGAEAEVAELRRLIVEHKVATEVSEAADERRAEIQQAYNDSHSGQRCRCISTAVAATMK